MLYRQGLVMLCGLGLPFSLLEAAPATTIIPNGLGTSVLSPANGIYFVQGGTTAGSNLFHSFSTFNLGNGDKVDFNVSSGIANIVARVTGGPSTIGGTITSTNVETGQLSTANLFFINPAGVMFTSTAQVNLGGSFIVSTADYVKFSDGSIFYGDINHPIQDAGLTSAAVSAFGFLPSGPQVLPPQAISFTGTQLENPGGIHLVGGGLSLDQGTSLLAPSGNLSLFSAASAGEVPFNLSSPGSGFSSATNSSFGNITVQNQSTVASEGNGGGIIIRGGNLVVDNSTIRSVNYGSVAGGNINVQADALTVRNGGSIGTDSYGAANAGSVDVEMAGNLSITGSQISPGTEISSDSESSGAAGQVTVDVGGAIALNDGGDIFSNSDGTGNGGTVMVQASSLSLGGNIAGDGSAISSVADGSGNAGTVFLQLKGDLSMTGNSSILAETYASGNGGTINVQAEQITMSDQAVISANSLFSSGTGGNIMVQTSSLSINNGSTISPAGITAESVAGTGNAGTIDVATKTLDLTNGALISTSSDFSGGDGGIVSISCSQGTLSGQSSISSSSTYTNAGTILINASESLSLLSGGVLDTSAGAEGGDITLRVGQMLYLRDSSIVAYAGLGSQFGAAVGGNGGNITIDPEFVVLDHSLISANDLSPTGHDGNIVNFSDYFLSTDSTLFATGTIDTTAPDLDLAKSLTGLPGNLIDAQTKLRESCAQSINHEFSTFILVGRGGTESGPEELQADFGMTAPSGGATP